LLFFVRPVVDFARFLPHPLPLAPPQKGTKLEKESVQMAGSGS